MYGPTHHHTHGCCAHACHHGCDCVDPALYAVGELVLAPFVLIGSVLLWAAKHPAGAAVALAVALVALALAGVLA